MEINYDEIINRKTELITFPGYIPFLIDQVVPSMERYKFLKKTGIYNKVSNELLRCRKYTLDQQMMEVKKWIDENPEYKDFIVED